MTVGVIAVVTLAAASLLMRRRPVLPGIQEEPKVVDVDDLYAAGL